MTDTEQKISPELLKQIKKSQLDEETGAIIYTYMASREKNAENKTILQEMSADEKNHAEVWQSYSGVSLRPRHLKIIWLKILTRVLGVTFVVKTLQKGEQFSQQTYELLSEQIPEARKMLDDERRHENQLYNMLDEERLQYLGAMVLGLNDALVELTGAIAGVTFALANNRLVALTGIITGISATLSMATSNFLAEQAVGNPNALKSSIYTGVAYLITVAILILPYLLFPVHMHIAAFFCMIGLVILIIVVFNLYISVAKGDPFLRRFAEMAIISLSVAAISFVIGLLAKKFLGLDA